MFLQNFPKLFIMSQQTINQQKQSIRKNIRQIRNKIPENESSLAALKLAQQLSVLDEYQQAKQIACFISFDGEINTQPIIEMLLRDKSVCYLPKLRPLKPNRLWFTPYSCQSTLVNNRFGIPEVDSPVNHAVAVSKLDIILMPLVAFDKQGNRLGMGGGFYDATLAHLTTQSNIKKKKPLCIGVAFEQQKVAQLPTQAWDISLNGVLTQENFYFFNRKI